MKKLLAAIGLVLISALPAVAQFSAPYKWSAAGKTYVYVPNIPANQPISLNVNSTETIALEFGNGCGWGFLKKKPTTAKTLVSFVGLNGGSGLNSANAVSSGFNWDCAAGGHDAPFNTVIETADGYWMRTDYGYQVRNMSVTYSKAAKVNANDCGFGRIATSATRTLESFSIAGTNYTLAALPAASAPQICKAPYTGAPKVLYQPQ